jgi:hypothetical protein
MEAMHTVEAEAKEKAHQEGSFDNHTQLCQTADFSQLLLKWRPCMSPRPKPKTRLPKKVHASCSVPPEASLTDPAAAKMEAMHVAEAQAKDKAAQDGKSTQAVNLFHDH